MKQQKNNQNNKKQHHPNPKSPRIALDTSVIQIDGSYGEGGGQVLRNCFSLSVLTEKSIQISKIRAKRSKPGLAAQHLTGIQLVSNMCPGSNLQGALVGSMDVLFKPTKLKAGVYEANTRTAGSVCLLIQVTFPCIIFGPGNFEITYKGGTDAILAPQTDYLLKVFKPFVQRFGIEFDMELIMRGFYPKGGGVVKIKTKPLMSLLPIQVEERGDITHIEIYAFCSGSIPDHVPKRMADTALSILKNFFKDFNNIEYTVNAVKESKDTSFGDGTAIMITALTSTGCILCGSSIGERGKKSEDVGAEAAEHLCKDISHGGCVDEYLQDQIIIFMGLADGVSRIKVGPLSEHTTTSIHFTEFLTGAKFTVTEAPRNGTEDTYWLTCNGIGYRNPYLT